MNKITAIIPTFNRSVLLNRAIESVLSQTYGNLALRIYDNASVDDTEQLVTSLMNTDSRVIYYKHVVNIGAMSNFTFAVDSQRIDTEFFCILCDDDFLLPEFFKTAIGYLQENSDAMFCALPVVVRNEKNGNEATRRFPSGYYEPPNGFAQMITSLPPVLTGMLFRTSVLDKVGGFDAATGMSSDHEFEYRIAAHCAYVVSNDVVGGVCCYHGDTVTGNLAVADAMKNRMATLKKIRDVFPVPCEMARWAIGVLKKRYARMIQKKMLKSFVTLHWKECMKIGRILMEFNRHTIFDTMDLEGRK